MELPSKELLSAVLHKHNIHNIQIKENNIIFSCRNTEKDFIEFKSLNIYELMHLMKEWAIKLDKQYELVSYKKNSGKGMCEVYVTWHGNEAYGDYEYDTVEATEFEAVTKACEWILKESK